MNPFEEFIYGLGAYATITKIGAIVIFALSIINFIMLFYIIIQLQETQDLIKSVRKKIEKSEAQDN